MLRSQQCNPIQLAALLAICSGLMHAGVSGVLVMPVSQTIFIVFLAAYVAFGKQQEVLSLRSPWLINSVVLIGCSVLILGYLYISFENSLWAPDMCVVKVGPRFWVDGGIFSCE